MTPQSKLSDMLCPIMLFLACALTSYAHFFAPVWSSHLATWAAARTTYIQHQAALLPWSIEHQQLNLTSNPHQQPRDHIRRAIGQALLRITTDHPLSGHCQLSRTGRRQPLIFRCTNTQVSQALSILPAMLLKEGPVMAQFKSAVIDFSLMGAAITHIYFF